MKGGIKMFFKSKTKNEIELMNREILDLKRRIKVLEMTRDNSKKNNNDLFKKWQKFGGESYKCTYEQKKRK